MCTHDRARPPSASSHYSTLTKLLISNTTLLVRDSVTNPSPILSHLPSCPSYHPSPTPPRSPVSPPPPPPPPPPFPQHCASSPGKNDQPLPRSTSPLSTSCPYSLEGLCIASLIGMREFGQVKCSLQIVLVSTCVLSICLDIYLL